VVKARILTFNTLYKGQSRARLRALCSLLEASDYDIVCLQELAYPQNFSLVRSLTPSFPYASYGARLPLVRGGLLTLSRIPVVGERFVQYGRHGPVRGEMSWRKGVLVTRFAQGDVFFTVANTHLSANKTGSWDRSVPFTQVQQAELTDLSRAVNRISTGEPVVVVGDFNVPRDSWLLADFKEATGLQDAFAGSTESTYRSWSGGSLDQVLVSPGLKATAAVALTEKTRLDNGQCAYLSDHYAVAADIVTGS
jgi:endonuclease/exonuclease/phosphatase family metal-dependent hydrolase